MALITCPECGKEISNQAKSCPYCGYPIAPEEEPTENANENFEKPTTPVNNNPPKSGRGSSCLITILFMFIVFVIAGFFTGSCGT